MIYLLRHGIDDEKYIGGWSDIELTPEGIEQVSLATEYITENNLSIDQIISSDIKRARQTADIVASKLGVVVSYDSRLRELDKGLLTGLKREVAEDLFPDYISGVDIFSRYPEGESMEDLYVRQKETLKWLLSQDDILIVTHRGVINMYYFILNEIPLSSDKELFAVTHSSIHELDVTRKRIRKIFDPKGGR